MAVSDLSALTALALGRRLAAGERDPLELCEETLARAAGAPLRHAFVELTAERARAEATASAQRHAVGRPLGPLDGVPVAWKDLFDVAGTPTTAGSALRRDAHPAAADAPVVANLAAAGMVCIGKTNLTELAFSGLGLNPHFGTPRNPFGDAPRVPGGSSSGSAVAVAAGAVPCAIGTDTSGSVRVPAAFCGLVGYKPTAERFDRRGVFPLAPTQDSVGPLARSVADVVALDVALRGVASPRREPVPVGDVVLVVPGGELVDDVAPDVASRFAEALAALEHDGATVQRRPLRALDDAQRLTDEHGTVGLAEATRTHARLLESPDAARVDRRVIERLRGGHAVLAHGYDLLLAERPRLQAELAAQLGGGFAIFPAVRHTAPELAPLERDEALFARVNLRTLRSTMLASYLDMPGVTLPIGLDRDGLPVGVLVSGAAGDDDRLLDAALAVERALGA